MNEKYSDDVLNLKFSVEVLDGIKPIKTFFAINEETLRNVYHVLPSDSVDEARNKIMKVVSTDDFLYKYFNKDPRSWELKEFTPGYWTTPVKVEKLLSRDDIEDLGYSDDEIERMRLPLKDVSVSQTFQEKLTVRFGKRNPVNAMSDESFFKIYEDEFKDFLAHDNVYTAILKNKFATKPLKVTNKRNYDPEKLLVIPDVELHLGKLASKFDSTDSYDYKKALYRYIKIISEAEKVQQTYNAKDICMTIGNDFFNTDTEQNTTTAGTEQHNDTRFQQMIATGIVAHVWAIERMKNNCEKLILKFNPGNHDYLTDYTLFMQLYYLYRNDPKVEVECRVKDSRWVTCLVWHNNLIIFAHGKTPEGRALKDDDLALLPSTMFKEEAKGVDNVTVHAGHLHNSTENNFSKKTKASNGTTILRNGSPSGDGAWDSGNLYRSDKSHQVYVYDANRGFYSTINIKLTKDELERGINLGGITDETDYLRAVEKSIDAKADDVLVDDIKRLKANNEREIKKIDKKYEQKLRQIEAIISGLTEEQRSSILNVIGYNEELKPYVETREMLYNQLSKGDRKLTLTKKPN